MKTFAAIVCFLVSIGMAVAGGSNTTLIVQWNGTNFVTRTGAVETIIGSSGVFVNTNGLGGAGAGYYCMSNGQWTVFVPGSGSGSGGGATFTTNNTLASVDGTNFTGRFEEKYFLFTNSVFTNWIVMLTNEWRIYRNTGGVISTNILNLD